MHALIIEPDAWIVLMIEEALCGLGFRTFDYASSAGEAEQLFAGTKPDLVTSGVRLDDGSPVDVVEAMCSRAAVPAIFITSTAWDVRRRHPNAVIVQKPFARAGLQKVVRAILPEIECAPG